MYSVDGVVAESASLEKPKEYRPFYSLRHGLEETDEKEAEAFWFSVRRPSARSKELDSDVFLSFVDRGFNLSNTANESITVKVTCSNRDMSSHLKTNVWGELDIESGAMVRTRLVEGPTKTVRP